MFADVKLETREEYQKSQVIRLIDIFIIGPILIFASTKLDGLLKIAVLIIGIATIVYNANNFLKNKQVNG